MVVPKKAEDWWEESHQKVDRNLTISLFDNTRCNHTGKSQTFKSFVDKLITISRKIILLKEMYRVAWRTGCAKLFKEISPHV